MIGGNGGNVLRELGPPPRKPDEELSPEALQLRKFARALRGGEPDRPARVLDGQVSLEERNE
jgi:hypothetical protein